MSVAIRTATRLQDQDDVNVTLGAGVDEYALCWDNDTARFVLRAIAGGGVTDHGALTGLSDDDHTGYALLAGRAGGQTLYGGNAANDDITIHGTSNATRTTSHVLLQPSGGNVGIGTTSPARLLHVYGADGIIAEDSSGYGFYTAKKNNHLTQNAYFDGNWKSYGSSSTFGSAILFQTDGQNENALNILSDNSIAAANEILTLVSQMVVKTTGNVGIGTTAPATLLHSRLASAATNAVTNVLTIGHDTTGTATAGFGAGVLFQLESSTTAAQDAAQIAALWTNATHATRASALTFSTLTAAGALTEQMRIDGAGNVGIGSPSTGAAVYVYRTTGVKINLVGEHPGLEYGNIAATIGSRAWMNSDSGDFYFDVASGGSWRTGIQIASSGSAAAVGFLGATPAARIAHVADPAGGGTVDAEARSAINSILATLESFGFHATS